jgi:hypothetical protein
MSIVTESLSARDRARFLEAARVAGLWYRHNQNAPGQPWGGVDQSADLGRYLYEYFPATGQCRGTGVWSQAIASVALLYLDEAFKDSELGFREAAERGIGYLKSLQYLDSRNAKAYGGFREHNPQTVWSYPRDGATGCFGLAVWARETGDADALERADLFCKWYSSHGSAGDVWPDCEYRFDTGEGEPKVRGDWQAGGGLCYYYTARAAKDEKWIEKGFRPMMEILAQIGDPSDVDGVESGWHGQSRITVGNDDFATVALLAAFLTFDDEKFLDVARKRVSYYLSLQAEDGSFPNYGGTFVTALTLLDFAQLATERQLPDDMGPVIDALLKAAYFGLSLQCTEHRDRRAYGGLWGQSSFGVGRDRIHNRSTTYATHLWLRLAGHRAPCLSALGW